MPLGRFRGQTLQRGGHLTRSERVMLQGLAATVVQTRSVAENDVELAKILGVTRRTPQSGRKRRDAPPPAANGFHEGLGSGGA